MAIIFDPLERERALVERGVDFARCSEIFAERHVTFEDTRVNYDECRYVTLGLLDGVMMVVVWTPRDGHERIISLRKANDREQRHYGYKLD